MIGKHYMRQVVVFYQNDKEGAMECIELCQIIGQILKQSAVLFCYRYIFCHLGQWLIIESRHFWCLPKGQSVMERVLNTACDSDIILLQHLNSP